MDAGRPTVRRPRNIRVARDSDRIDCHRPEFGIRKAAAFRARPAIRSCSLPLTHRTAGMEAWASTPAHGIIAALELNAVNLFDYTSRPRLAGGKRLTAAAAWAVAELAAAVLHAD